MLNSTLQEFLEYLGSVDEMKKKFDRIHIIDEFGKTVLSISRELFGQITFDNNINSLPVFESKAINYELSLFVPAHDITAFNEFRAAASRIGKCEAWGEPQFIGNYDKELDRFTGIHAEYYYRIGARLFEARLDTKKVE